MRCLRVLPAACAALMVLAPRVSADDSVFGIRGLGLLGRPVSARTAGSAGGFAMFDPGSMFNPAAFGRWLTASGWMVAVPSRRDFVAGTQSATLTTTRFPTFGFATPVGPRWVVGVGIGDYLDRSWSVSQTDTLMLRGTPERLLDVSQSVGGVSDLQLTAAYHLTDHIDVGGAFHALTGSARLTVSRDFESTAYADFSDVAVTNYRGFGLSVGAVAQVSSRLGLAGSLRLNSSLTSEVVDGSRSSVQLPVEFGVGANLLVTSGLSVAATASFAGWASAADDLAALGEERSRNVWSVAAGAEYQAPNRRGSSMPLRAGFRWRQLPFPVQGAMITESAVSAGIGRTLAGGHATVNLGLERGSRKAGTTSESFTNVYVGLIVRP